MIIFFIGNDKRDFTLYLFFERFKTNLILNRLNITVLSCESNNMKSYKFETEFTQLDDLLTNINDANWFPIVIYNTNWSSIEFICSIKIDIISIMSEENLINSFKQVCLLNLATKN